MIDGTYSIVMKTPMGVKKGELVFATDNSRERDAGRLSGAFIVNNKKNPFDGGTTDGDSFTFSGTLLSSVGKMDYECTGNVIGDALEATAVAKRGTLVINGVRKG